MPTCLAAYTSRTLPLSQVGVPESPLGPWMQVVHWGADSRQQVTKWGVEVGLGFIKGVLMNNEHCGHWGLSLQVGSTPGLPHSGRCWRLRSGADVTCPCVLRGGPRPRPGVACQGSSSCPVWLQTCCKQKAGSRHQHHPPAHSSVVSSCVAVAGRCSCLCCSPLLVLR